MLIKRCVLRQLERRINLDIAPLPSDEIAQVHGIRDGLDASSNNLNQVLKDQGEQVDLVASLEMVHDLIVNMAHHGML